MKILLTGATGFIGKQLLKRLLSEKHKIISINRNITDVKYAESIIEYPLHYENPLIDIDFFRKEKIDGVIHLASYFIVNNKPEDIVSLINSNILLGTHILECSAKAQASWFINTGTFWQHYEKKDYSPVNLYAATKQAFQDIAKFYIETNKINFVTVKIADTFGSGDTRPKVFNLLKKIAFTDEQLNMSPGNQIIDFTHICDVVDGFSQLITLLQKGVVNSGACFAMKAEHKYTLKEIVQVFERVIGKKLKINWGELCYRDREIMCPYDKFENIPGWKPKLSLEEGIKESLQETM